MRAIVCEKTPGLAHRRRSQLGDRRRRTPNAPVFSGMTSTLILICSVTQKLMQICGKRCANAPPV